MGKGKRWEATRKSRVEIRRGRLGAGKREKFKLLPIVTPQRKRVLDDSSFPLGSRSRNIHSSGRNRAGGEHDLFDNNVFVPFTLDNQWRKKTKSSHDYMREWIPKESSYLDVLISLEAPPLVHQCAQCKSSCAKLWRCKDCFGNRVLCHTCLRNEHQYHPLHRVQVWNGRYFAPSWLWKVGTFISLCPSNKCATTGGLERPSDDPVIPEASDEDQESEDNTELNHEDFTFGAKPPSTFLEGRKVVVVVHSNAVHHLPLDPCWCPGAPSLEIQLLRAGFYPATFTNIRTIFTQSMLDDYLLQSLECFTSSHHHFSKIRRMTNEPFPHSVPNRTRELRRVSRQWRRLKELKRYGHGHVSPGGPTEGSMALFCPACPQAGLNLPDHWERDPERWKYQRSLVADGNFTCVHRKQKNDSQDVYLKSGEGYITEKGRYMKHVSSANEDKEKPTCHEHRAIADKSKVHKGCDATGVGAIACMRHGCFAPGSVVDFQKGERQLNMDYALCEAIKTTGAEEMGKVLLAYDVNCQYSKNLSKRIEKGRYLDIPEDLEITPAIGLFHVHGHQESCYARYALTFIKGAGVSAGEILESLWSVINEAARATSVMTAAHRVEVLDAVIGDSNWKKLINIVEWICKNWEVSRLESLRASEDFELLDETASPAQRALWLSQLENANANRLEDVTVMDAINTNVHKPPSRAKVQNELMERERVLDVGLGVSSWISKGLKIQESQLTIKTFARSLPREDLQTEKQRLDLSKRKETLQSEINDFFEGAAVLFPSIDFKDIQCVRVPDDEVEIHGDDGEDNPFVALREVESVEIPLPSSFINLPPAMTSAAKKEIKLRIAQADDALEGIRDDVGHKSYLYRSNIRLAQRKTERTRGFDAVKGVDRSMRNHIQVYNQARWALKRLCREGDEVLGRYQVVTKGDTKAITAVYQPNASGQRNTTLSWIWMANVQHESASSSYLEECEWIRIESLAYTDGAVGEVYRVNWIRAKSRAMRWHEEHSLLTSEMEWVVRFMDFKEDNCKAWGNLTRDRPGHRAYAERQAAMWRLMGAHAEKQFEAARSVIDESI